MTLLLFSEEDRKQKNISIFIDYIGFYLLLTGFTLAFNGTLIRDFYKLYKLAITCLLKVYLFLYHLFFMSKFEKKFRRKRKKLERF